MKKTVKQRGVALLEVVIALFIVGFGLVAVAMFSNELFTESGQVKARTEALQYAQEDVENLRRIADQSGLAAVASEAAPGPETGTNAVFTLSRTVNLQSDPDYAEVAVVVSWSDKDGSYSVSLDAQIASSDSDAVNGLVAGSLLGGGFIDEPIGSAKYLNDIAINTLGLDDNDKVSEGKGTKVYKGVSDSGTETFYLVDESNNAVLSNNSNFNTVTGRVMVEYGHSVTAANIDNIEVVPSDTGVCRKALKQADDSSWITDTTHLYALNGELKEFDEGAEDAGAVQVGYFFEYTCYFGSGWYGNIGVLRNDSPVNSNDRTCGGDPNVGGDDGTDVSRHPQLMATRMYRGFTPEVEFDENTQTYVPFIDENNNWIYLSKGMVSGHNYGATANSADDPQIHDFLLTNISGTVDDSDCHDKLVGSDFDSDLDADISYFKNNAGSFVCIVDSRFEANCPDIIPTGLGEKVEATAHQYTGLITSDVDLVSAEKNGLAIETSQGGDCTIGTWAYDSGEEHYAARWTCNVYHYSQTDADATTILTDTWAGQISISSNEENADGGAFSPLNICSVSRFNTTLDIDNSDSGISFDVSPNSCGVSTITISGSVESANKTKTIDLTGYFVEAVDGETSTNCGALVTMYPEATHGFSCALPSGFTGTISINDMPAKHRVKSDLDFSGSPVTENLSGQIIQIQ